MATWHPLFCETSKKVARKFLANWHFLGLGLIPFLGFSPFFLFFIYIYSFLSFFLHYVFFLLLFAFLSFNVLFISLLSYFSFSPLPFKITSFLSFFSLFLFLFCLFSYFIIFLSFFFMCNIAMSIRAFFNAKAAMEERPNFHDASRADSHIKCLPFYITFQHCTLFMTLSENVHPFCNIFPDLPLFKIRLYPFITGWTIFIMWLTKAGLLV
jgi:hypothetical protein